MTAISVADEEAKPTSSLRSLDAMTPRSQVSSPVLVPLTARSGHHLPATSHSSYSARRRGQALQQFPSEVPPPTKSSGKETKPNHRAGGSLCSGAQRASLAVRSLSRKELHEKPWPNSQTTRR